PQRMVPLCLAALRGAAGPVRQAAVEYRLAPRPPTSQARPAPPPLPISSPLDPRYDSTVITNSNPEHPNVKQLLTVPNLLTNSNVAAMNCDSNRGIGFLPLDARRSVVDLEFAFLC